MWRDHTITVAPIEGGWSVSFDDDMQPLVFLSGARAEAHARGIALRLAGLGDDVEVRIHDLRGALAGATRYRAQTDIVEFRPVA